MHILETGFSCRGSACFLKKMPFDGVSGGACSVDVVENIAAGGLCFEETESVVKCGPKKIVAGIYFMIHLGLSITSAVLERMAIDACISKEHEISTEIANDFGSITNLVYADNEVSKKDYLDIIYYNNTSNNTNVGLQIWENSFWVLTFAVIPLQVWLLVYGLLGLRYCPCKLNPFCFCFKKEDSQSSTYKTCMKINLLLFLLFDDLVHIAISIGRMNYKSHSITSENAFKQAFAVNVAMYIETAADSFNLLYRWKSIYWFHNCRKENVGEQREDRKITLIFQPLQFLVSATTLYFAVVLITGLSSWPVTAIAGLYVGWMMGICFLSVILTITVGCLHATCC